MTHSNSSKPASFMLLSLLSACAAKVDVGIDSDAGASPGLRSNTGGYGNVTLGGIGGAATAAGAAQTNGGAALGVGAASYGGAALGSCAGRVLYDFSNQTLQGFSFDYAPGSPPYVNLAAPPPGPVISGATPELQWSSKEFDGAITTPGSMLISATFTDWNQNVAVEVNGPTDVNGNPLDLTGQVLHAKVLLVRGLSPNPSAPGGIVFYLKTGATYAWGQAPWMNLSSPGSWMDLAFDTSSPASGTGVNFDPKLPLQLGFLISSGGGGTVGPFGSSALDTLVYIDLITMVPSTCP